MQMDPRMYAQAAASLRALLAPMNRMMPVISNRIVARIMAKNVVAQERNCTSNIQRQASPKEMATPMSR